MKKAEIIKRFMEMVGEQLYKDYRGYYYVDADGIIHHVTYNWMKFKVLGE